MWRKRPEKVIRTTRDQLCNDKDDMTDLLCEMAGVTNYGITDKEAAIAMARAIHNLEEALIKEIERRQAYGR